MTRTHHRSITRSSFAARSCLRALPVSPSRSRSPGNREPAVVVASPFPRFHLVGIIPHVVSPHCLLPRSNTYLSVFLFFSFHGSIAFLFSFFIFSTIKSCRVNALRLVHPSPTEGRLGGFRVLAVMQKAAVNIHARVFCVGRQVLVSLVKYPGAQFLDRAGKARLAL